ncbi:MAG: FHA domain-containing protein [Planctomycetes bacterium]|nr:FHA domain-containing protein [Planctomycetota bacterium]
MPLLFIETGRQMGHALPLKTAVTIGRDPQCELALADERASRRHVTLTPGPDGILLEDLGSANGTYVNGQRVRRASLTVGDRIAIGETTIAVVAAPGERTSAPAPPAAPAASAEAPAAHPRAAGGASPGARPPAPRPRPDAAGLLDPEGEREVTALAVAEYLSFTIFLVVLFLAASDLTRLLLSAPGH